MKTKFLKFLIALTAVSLLAACGGPAKTNSNNGAGTVKLILGAYTTPREAYGELIPIFASQWKEKKGQEVTVEDTTSGKEDLKTMTLEELNELLNNVLESEDYIRAVAIRDEINSRKKK